MSIQRVGEWESIPYSTFFLRNASLEKGIKGLYWKETRQQRYLIASVIGAEDRFALISLGAGTEVMFKPKGARPEAIL